MRRVVQFGHDEAGLDIVGVEQPRLSRAQQGIAIIALCKKHPRLGHAVLLLEMPVDGTSGKKRQRQNDGRDNADGDPDLQRFAFVVKLVLITHATSCRKTLAF